MNIIERRRRYIGGLPTGYSNTGAVTLDGSNDFIELGYQPGAALRNSFTIGFWIKSASLNAGNGSGGLKYLFNIYQSGNEQIGISIDGPGKIRIEFVVAGSSGRILQGTDSTPYSSGSTSGNWDHIGLVVTEGASGSDNTTMKIFRNGSVLASTVTGGTVTSTQQSAAGWAGNFGAFGALRHSGGTLSNIPTSIDEMAMWTVALDDAAMAVVGNTTDIKDLTEDSGNYDNSGDLEFYYKLNEGTDANAADSSGNGHTAVLTNGPTWISGASN
jgi:hypothetical protein